MREREGGEKGMSVPERKGEKYRQREDAHEHVILRQFLDIQSSFLTDIIVWLPWEFFKLHF